MLTLSPVSVLSAVFNEAQSILGATSDLLVIGVGSLAGIVLAASCWRKPSRFKRIASVLLGFAVGTKAWSWISLGHLSSDGMLHMGAALIVSVAAVVAGIFARDHVDLRRST